MSEDAELIVEVVGHVGRLTLNRPRALNAWSHGMCRAFDGALEEWERDDRVHAVLIKSACERAFSTGGDVVWLHGARERLEEYGYPYYRDGYRGNARLHRFPKPYVALIDGLIMGVGVGISVHGSHTIASERARLAMPETGIGLFPDVGATHVLPRCPGQVGLYLGLTGARIGVADMLYAGLADHHVPHDRLEALEGILLDADLREDAHLTVERIVGLFAERPGPAPLAEHRAAIDLCFQATTVEGILAALEAEATEWALDTLEVLRSKSPTSLKVTLRQLRTGARLGFDEAMRLEYRLVRRFLARPDYYEGVRAQVIDRDGAPRWRPATLAEVSEAEVDAFFAPIGAAELAFDWEGPARGPGRT